MLETELVSLDREPRGIQWPPQDELIADPDVPNVGSEKEVRQKCVGFFLYIFIHNAGCILVDCLRQDSGL